MNPYVKYWQSALQKTITNKPRKIMTPGECAQQKIRMSETLLKSAFEKESKLFLQNSRSLNIYHHRDAMRI